MVGVRVTDDAVDAVFARGGGVVGGAEGDAGEVAVAAFTPVLATEEAEPIHRAVFMGMQAELSQVIEVGGVLRVV